MKNASANEIRNEMYSYLQFARNVYTQMQKEHLSACDNVIDGAKELEDIINEAVEIILKC